jgi:hypothetical protein
MMSFESQGFSINSLRNEISYIRRDAETGLAI